MVSRLLKYLLHAELRYSKKDHHSFGCTLVVVAKAQEYLRQKQAEADGRQSSEAKPLNDDFIVEPDLETVLGVLIPKQLRLMIYTALLDSQASEHASSS